MRSEYAAKLKTQVDSDAVVVKLQDSNKALNLRYTKMKDQLAKALDDHELGAEMVSLHEEVIHAQEAKAKAEHAATTKSLEVEELAQRTERLGAQLTQQTTELTNAQQRLAQLEPAAAAAEASNIERGRRIKELERQHKAKARECLSFAAEKATSSIQRTSKDSTAERLLKQATTANEVRWFRWSTY